MARNNEDTESRMNTLRGIFDQWERNDRNAAPDHTLPAHHRGEALNEQGEEQDKEQVEAQVEAQGKEQVEEQVEAQGEKLGQDGFGEGGDDSEPEPELEHEPGPRTLEDDLMESVEVPKGTELYYRTSGVNPEVSKCNFVKAERRKTTGWYVTASVPIMGNWQPYRAGDFMRAAEGGGEPEWPQQQAWKQPPVVTGFAKDVIDVDAKEAVGDAAEDDEFDVMPERGGAVKDVLDARFRSNQRQPEVWVERPDGKTEWAFVTDIKYNHVDWAKFPKVRDEVDALINEFQVRNQGPAPTMKFSKVISISLFSAGGGWRVGMTELGAECAFCIDCDHQANRINKHNFKGEVEMRYRGAGFSGTPQLGTPTILSMSISFDNRDYYLIMEWIQQVRTANPDAYVRERASARAREPRAC
jgi:hypothetical protein